MAPGYSISYFSTQGLSHKTYTWAEYVDRPENGGNNNDKVDDKEIELFKKIIKYRYGYDYDFNRPDSAQNAEICDKEETLNTNFAKTALNEGGPFEKAYNIGDEAAYTLRRTPSEERYEKLSAMIKSVVDYPVESKKLDCVKSFFLGYACNDSGLHGFFEQIGSKNNSKLTYGNVMPLIKTVLDVVPNDKKQSKAYNKIVEFYDKYKDVNQDELFKNNDSGIARFFGVDELDNLDEAIEEVLL